MEKNIAKPKPTRLQKDCVCFSHSLFFSGCFAANIIQHFICLLTRWLSIFKQEKRTKQKTLPIANKTFFLNNFWLNLCQYSILEMLYVFTNIPF